MFNNVFTILNILINKKIKMLVFKTMNVFYLLLNCIKTKLRIGITKYLKHEFDLVI